MVWRADGPMGDEAAKIRHLVVPYTRGKGLDIGCGQYKAFPHFIGVDSGKDYHGQGVTDIKSDGSDLSLFADGSMDFVFSSHFLEHVVDMDATLKEWWRVIRPKGHLVLYLPHEDLYPRCGEPGANPDHKRDFNPDIVIDAVKRAAGKGLRPVIVENEVRSAGDGMDPMSEYSFFLVFSKGGETPKKIPTDQKRLLIIRYGAFGDHIMASSIFPLLKKEGWHITYNTTPRGEEVLRADPHIDAFLIQDTDQVPNTILQHYWSRLAERYDRVINLSESIEGNLLAMDGRSNNSWPDNVRRKLLNVNYLERTHDIAEVPHDIEPVFRALTREVIDAEKITRKWKGKAIGISLSGSSVHKTYPYFPAVVTGLLRMTDATIVLLGGPECPILEEYIVETQPEDIDRSRIVCLSGKLPIRDSMILATQFIDVMIGPETGLMNAASHDENNGKVVLLSHSSEENLTKHWRKTIAITPDTAQAACYPCHRLHYSFKNCHQHEETGAALCAAAIHPDRVIAAALELLPICACRSVI